MAVKTKISATAAPSYVDFDPVCDLLKEEGLVTLIIHLPDFKKNQIKVQVSKDGVLRVSGERPTNADGLTRSRFVKDTKLVDNCDVNGIRAKFINGNLHVTMPTKVIVTPQVIKEQPTSTSSPLPPPPPPPPPPQPEAGSKSDEQVPKCTSTSIENGKMAETHTSKDESSQGEHIMYEHGSIMQMLHLQGRKVAALGFGVAVVTMVAIGAFVAS